MKVLVACEFSGIVREAFRRLGHEAWSCDIIDSEDNSRFHIKGDAINNLSNGFDLIIAHPPCTFLCNSGVRWLYRGGKGNTRNEGRWESMKDAAKFFLQFFNHYDGPLAVENPIMHSHAAEIVGNVARRQIIQPWQFGCPETKATVLWLRGLPDLKPTNIVSGRFARSHLTGESKNRWKNRSRTITGIAEAMADQWGDYLENLSKKV